jgi:quercetin 2,3-dioxygenase
MSEVSRREAIRMMAAAGVAATTGCTNTEENPDDVAVPMKKTVEAISEPEPVLRITPLPSAGPWPTEDPFLFCVHHNDVYPAGNGELGPQASLEGRDMGQDFGRKDGWSMYHGMTVPGFPRHPHRGFETVTLVEKGLIDHADSLGAAARYGDGDVQWLTAGDGIMHAEMFPLLDRGQENPIDFFQIWVNLPAARKRAQPHFSMFWKKQIPVLTSADGQGRKTVVKVVAGSYRQNQAPPPPPNSWASEDGSDVAIWTVKLDAGAKWTLPLAAATTRRSLYVVRGSGVVIGGQRIGAQNRIELEGGLDVELAEAGEGTDLLLLQGRPIGEPVVKYGPFVMNSRAEIQQAYADYSRTRFGGWDFDRDDPVHGAEYRRFARLIDGSEDSPG